MDKKASKRSAPSLRAKKKSTDRQKSTSRPSSQNSKNTSSSKQKKEASQNSKRGTPCGRSVMIVDREPATDNDKNKKKDEKKKDVKKKSSEVEKKVDRTQDDPTKEEPKKAATETISNIEVIPDKNPAKMDDGYEDFGPGAA